MVVALHFTFSDLKNVRNVGLVLIDKFNFIPAQVKASLHDFIVSIVDYIMIDYISINKLTLTV